MSIRAQADLDWAGADSAPSGGAGVSPAGGAAYLSDEEILGMEPLSPEGGYGGPSAANLPPNRFVIPSEATNPYGGFADGVQTPQRDSSGENRPRNDRNLEGDGAGGAAELSRAKTPQAEARATGGSATAEMPGWMAAAAADPAHGGEAAALWREHQEFRAAFASPEEARAVKELLPGGVRDVLSLREATQSVERIDAALFSGDARAQAEVVAEMARANPAAFRSLFAEAAKFLAGGGVEVRGSDLSGPVAGAQIPQRDSSGANRPRHDNVVENPSLASGELRASESPATSHQSRVTSHAFDPAAYAAFERATNDAVARDVRGSIGDTLARVMPEGVAEGAARRIGEDIFNEVHRALAADRALSEQVASILRDPSGASATGAARAAGASAGAGQSAGAWRFGSAEQQRVAALLAWRAKQLVPSVARRVIGEWTSSVLNTARAKSARQAAAAARVDIASPGGSLDATPLRQMPPREVNYANLSDEQILGM